MITRKYCWVCVWCVALEKNACWGIIEAPGDVLTDIHMAAPCSPQTPRPCLSQMTTGHPAIPIICVLITQPCWLFLQFSLLHLMTFYRFIAISSRNDKNALHVIEGLVHDPCLILSDTPMEICKLRMESLACRWHITEEVGSSMPEMWLVPVLAGHPPRIASFPL